MTSSTCQGTRRGAPCEEQTATGITLCGRCRTTAYYALANIGSYYADLDKIPTAGVRRRSNTAADPTGIAAARIIRDPVTEIDDKTVATLGGWADCLPGRHPRAVSDLVPWLTERLDKTVTNEWAARYLAELKALEKSLGMVAARADTGEYVGVCGNVLAAEQVHDERTCACACHSGLDLECDVPGGCGREYAVLPPELCDRPLYARRDAGWVPCLCGARWDVRGRRQQLVRDAEEELAPVAVIAHLAALWIGEPSVGKVESRINLWAHRKKIHHVTTKVIDGRERKVYRVGDVLDLLAATPSKSESPRSA